MFETYQWGFEPLRGKRVPTSIVLRNVIRSCLLLYRVDMSTVSESGRVRPLPV